MTLNVGIEIEFTRRRHEANDALQHPAEPVGNGDIGSGAISHEHGGEWTYEAIAYSPESTSGIEARTGSGGIPWYDAADWYSYTISEIEENFNAEFAPTGIYTNGATAGLHTHFSPVEEEDARELYELSQEPWMHVFASSSVARQPGGSVEEQIVPVVREKGGGYCELSSFNERHRSVVTRRSNQHWAWRLPEPPLPEHYELIIKFLHEFLEGDRDAAIRRAVNFVAEGDDRLTSVRRAQAIGNVNTEHPSATSATEVLDYVT